MSSVPWRGGLVDSILKGEKPAGFQWKRRQVELVINLKTAKASAHFPPFFPRGRGGDKKGLRNVGWFWGGGGGGV